MKLSSNYLGVLTSFLVLQTSSNVMAAPTPTKAGDNIPYDQKYIKLNANILRGNSYEEAVQGSKAAIIEKRDTDGSVTMQLTNANSFYQAVLEIGSQKTSVDILVDTGSSDLWVMNSNNTYCSGSTSGSSSSNNSKVKRYEHFSRGRNLLDVVNFAEHDPETKENDLEKRDNPLTDLGGYFTDIGVYSTDSVDAPQATVDCSAYGTFDPDGSDTFSSNGTKFAITYGDGTFANGTWGVDDVIFNGVTVKDLSFAVADQSDSTIGVLGIGLAQLETTYSGLSTSSSGYYTYENLPLSLVSQGYINSATYSVYLNDSDATVASILFGAVDHNKYSGDLTLMPMVNTMESYGYKNPITMSVTISSLSLKDGSSESTIGTGAAAALLDTGTTLTYVPYSVLSEIVDLLGISYSSSLESYYMQCSDAEDYTFTFNFLGLDITVPLSSFLLEVTSSSAFGSSSTSNYCALGLYSSGDETFTLGDSFLRNVYFVADLPNYEVAMAQASYNSTSESIEVISDSIPSAVSAESYSSTYGGDNTALDVNTVSARLSGGSGSKTATRTGTKETSASGSESSAKSTSTSSSSSSTSKSGSPMTFQLSLPLLGFATVISLAIFI